MDVKILKVFPYINLRDIHYNFLYKKMKKRRTKESATYTWQIDNEKSKSETLQKYKCLDENHGYMF